jgi:hypothetical protein
MGVGRHKDACDKGIVGSSSVGNRIWPRSGYR